MAGEAATSKPKASSRKKRTSKPKNGRPSATKAPKEGVWKKEQKKEQPSKELLTLSEKDRIFLAEFGEYLDDDEDRPLIKLTEEEKKFYDPSSKGQASWDFEHIRAACGIIWEDFSPRKQDQEYFTGYDLVTWFTWKNRDRTNDWKRILEIPAKWRTFFESDASMPLFAQHELALHRKLYPEVSLEIIDPKDLPKQKNLRKRTEKPKKCLEKPKKCPGKSKKGRKGHSPFLKLPGEVRNLIYGYVIADSRILIQGNHPNKEYADRRKVWYSYTEPVKRPRFRLHHSMDNTDLKDGLEVPSGLLFTCKKIKKEIEMFVYSQLTFCFDTMKATNKFLDNSSKLGIEHIKKLELSHVCYGEPSIRCRSIIKARHDANWLATCRRISQRMPALEYLRIEIHITDWPATFGFQDFWWYTLMQLVHRGPLPDVEVFITHPRADSESSARMDYVSRRLENHMMTAEGQERRDEREAALALKLSEDQWEKEEAARKRKEAREEAARKRAEAALPLVRATRRLRVVIAESDDEEEPEKENVAVAEPVADTNSVVETEPNVESNPVTEIKEDPVTRNNSDLVIQDKNSAVVEIKPLVEDNPAIKNKDTPAVQNKNVAGVETKPAAKTNPVLSIKQVEAKPHVENNVITEAKLKHRYISDSYYQTAADNGWVSPTMDPEENTIIAIFRARNLTNKPKKYYTTKTTGYTKLPRYGVDYGV